MPAEEMIAIKRHVYPLKHGSVIIELPDLESMDRAEMCDVVCFLDLIKRVLLNRMAAKRKFFPSNWLPVKKEERNA